MEQKTLDALRWMIDIFNKYKIPYQISGGFSAKMYGSERKLNDIDFDIPEEMFGKILDDVRPYIIYGPTRYIDGKWDVEIITLDYNGQEIDISGAYTSKLSTLDRKEWISLPVNFNTNLKLELDGIHISVIHPKDLIEYKKHLDGEHQGKDIEAALNYINKNNL